jgi:hypothetical protein
MNYSSPLPVIDSERNRAENEGEQEKDNGGEKSSCLGGDNGINILRHSSKLKEFSPEEIPLSQEEKRQGIIKR